MDHGCGEFRLVAVAAEVAQDDAVEVRAGDRGDEFGGLVVGEVAVAVADALLGRPGALRVVHEEGLVVIGLGEKSIDALEPVEDEAGDVADIAEKTE